MDCNKDEAIRAKELAEKKVTEEDYLAAKKLAMKAEKLYPELEGISQLLTVIDIYLSSQKRINGEMDLYEILGAVPWATDEYLKKRFRRQALLLHPDKNNAVGANGAFQLLSSAWSVLSDKEKRSEYNQKLNRIPPSVCPYQTGFPFSTTSYQTGFPFESTSNRNSNAQPSPSSLDATSTVQPKASAARPEAPSGTRNFPNKARNSAAGEDDRFWTMCLDCKTQYEYHRKHLNLTLRCYRCAKPFFAFEKPSPEQEQAHPLANSSSQSTEPQSKRRGRKRKHTNLC